MKKSSFIFTILLACLVSISVSAQENKETKKNAGTKNTVQTNKGGAKKQTSQVGNDLYRDVMSLTGITKEQRQKLMELQKTQRTELQPIEAKLNNEKDAAAKEKLTKERTEKIKTYKTQLREVLTDAQKAEFDKKIAPNPYNFKPSAPRATNDALYNDCLAIKGLTDDQKAKINGMKDKNIKELKVIDEKMKAAKTKDEQDKVKKEIEKKINEHKTQLRALLTTDEQKAEFDKTIAKKPYTFVSQRAITLKKTDNKDGNKKTDNKKTDNKNQEKK